MAWNYSGCIKPDQTTLPVERALSRRGGGSLDSQKVHEFLGYSYLGQLLPRFQFPPSFRQTRPRNRQDDHGIAMVREH